jgi:L-rhamnose mutarotase
VGYLVTEDFAHALAAMQSLEVNTRWQTEMAPYFESNGLRADQQMQALEEIFHLE